MNIINKIAKDHNTSPDKVLKGIDLAISTAKSNPTSQEMWQKLFPGGNKPTAEEFIVTIANFIRANKQL